MWEQGGGVGGWGLGVWGCVEREERDDRDGGVEGERK
jgi:hypothetical protein